MKLGPNTKRALQDAGVKEEYLSGFENGSFEWDISRIPSTGHVKGEGREALASQIACELHERKNYEIQIYRSREKQISEVSYAVEMGVVDLEDRFIVGLAVGNLSGKRVISARHYDKANKDRNSAVSPVFAGGKLDDWTSIETNCSWEAVAWEFQEAADLLVKSFSTDTAFPSRVLLYLCRHYLELMLKAVIFNGRRLQDAATRIEIGHKLVPLWQTALPFIQEVEMISWEDGQEQEIEVARLLIEALAEIDPESMSMRYPVGKSGQPFLLPRTLANFAIKPFLSRFVRVGEFLSTQNACIQLQIEDKEKAKAREALLGQQPGQQDRR